MQLAQSRTLKNSHVCFRISD